MTDTILKIHGMIVDKLGIHQSEITEQTEFYDDLGVDSLDFGELIVSIEKSFNIVIEDDYYPKLKTVGALVQLVEQKVNSSPVRKVQYEHSQM